MDLWNCSLADFVEVADGGGIGVLLEHEFTRMNRVGAAAQLV